MEVESTKLLDIIPPPSHVHAMANVSIVEDVIKRRRQEEAVGSDEGLTLYYRRAYKIFYYFAYSTESLTDSLTDSLVDSMTTIGCVTAKKLKYVARYAVLPYCST
jgi:hypothetical protein